MPKATNTHSEYVILIAFPRQQGLHERASVLRYTYIACLVGKSLTVLSRDRMQRYGVSEPLGGILDFICRLRLRTGIF
jgi:hypothetical protein